MTARGRSVLMLKRVVYFALSCASGVGSALLLDSSMPGNGFARTAMIVLAALCLTWVSLSTWSAIIGFALTMHTRRPRTPGALRRRQRVAVLVPIFNEDCVRVFAGLAATFSSVVGVGRIDDFDFFVLSDSNDHAVVLAEEMAWEATCRSLAAEGRLFYRHRLDNRGRKAGNIADWVRTWGAAYDAFVILDADSIMSGSCLAALSDRMAATPDAGIIQTLPLAVGQRSLFGRAIQFSHRLSGPLLARGQHWWQGPDANYFGHNAIIRTRAFAANCGLPTLDGAPPLGGDILSHDFIEAACMRRGGWAVYGAPDLDGSYEQVPGNLIDYAIRERRWIQGNLQHAVLVDARGFAALSRYHLLTGILAFAMSPVWLAFLITATIVAASGDGGNEGRESLVASTAMASAIVLAILAIPRVLGAIVVWKLYPVAKRARFVRDVAIEFIFSSLLAPILMLIHSYFIIVNLSGHAIDWRPQRRGAHGLNWVEAGRRLFPCILVGLGWTALLIAIAPDLVLVVLPVLIGLLFAVPLVVWSSRGVNALDGLLAIPEDIAPPIELAGVDFDRYRLRHAESSVERGHPAAEPARSLVRSA